MEEASEKEAAEEETPGEETSDVEEAPEEEEADEEDEDTAPESAEPAPEPDEDLVPLTRMRQQISRVTVKSKQEKPHFYVSAEIDMTRAMEFRRQANSDLESEGVRVTVNDLIIKACAKALGEAPEV